MNQIEEMVKVLERSCDESKPCIVTCDKCRANALYNAGCRIHSKGRWVKHNVGYCSCSECHTVGSPQWKCCPVCMAVMEVAPEVEPYIDLNRATMEDLLKTGIGETRARCIIIRRDSVGGFSCMEDVKDCRAIGEKTYEKLRKVFYVGVEEEQK